MPWGLKRYQQMRQLHFVTFTCYHREQLLADPRMRDKFVQTPETVRRWYGFWVSGYVGHAGTRASARKQARTKNSGARAANAQANGLPRSRPGPANGPFWQARYYDFNIWSEAKRVEKLCYLHRNPVKQGLVERREDWPWSSFRHYLTGEEGPVEIESHWTANKRERLGIYPTIKLRAPTQNPPFASR